jgi:hypothetical protein
MSNNKGFSKIALVLVLVILSAVSGAIGGAFYSSQTQTTNTMSANVIPANLFLVTINDTTANRALNTSYLNSRNDGNVMFVYLILNLTSTTGGKTSAIAEVNTTIATLKNGTVGTIGASGNLNGTIQVQLSFYVPWGFSYRVNSTSTDALSTTTLVKWYESIPPTGFGAILQPILSSLLRRQLS